MKRTVFIASFFISLSVHAQQRFTAGLKAGLSTSQVAGDTYGGFHKAGFDGGIFITGQLNEKWTAQMEMIFIQKGSRHNGDPENGDYTYYYLGLNYAEVPLMFQYHQKKFVFEAGPAFGYLISNEEYNQNGPSVYPHPFNSTEISLGFGISYILIKNLSVNWRYSNSILPIRAYQPATRRMDIPGQRNNVLAFTLTYQFRKKNAVAE
jgi:hypothetical protein